MPDDQSPFGTLPGFVTSFGIDERDFNFMRSSYQDAVRNTPGYAKPGYVSPSQASDAGGVPLPPVRPDGLGATVPGLETDYKDNPLPVTGSTSAGLNASPKQGIGDENPAPAANAPFKLTDPTTWLPVFLDTLKGMAVNIVVILIALVAVIIGVITLTKANG